MFKTGIMRYVKLLIISFLVLFILITGISLFIPSRVRISKAINMKADKGIIMEQIRDASKWKNWYPGLDSTRPLYVEGVMKGVVFDSSSADAAYLVIDKEEPGQVTAKFVGKRMKPVINVWKTINYPNSDSTTLQWYMDFHLRWYPWEKFSSLLLEQSFGPRMEQGLKRLKENIEAPDK